MAEEEHAGKQAEEPNTIRPDQDRFLRDLARQNQELEAQYGGEESLGQKRPMSLWERLRQAISVLASTGPTR